MATIKEDKQLLFKDFCARFPYGIKGIHRGQVHIITNMDSNSLFPSIKVDGYDAWFPVETFKPYLRSLSSMTEEERKELEKITNYTFEYKKGERDIWTKSYHRCYLFGGDGKLYGAGEPINMLCSSELCTKLIDWLNMHHFDYRHLIERGLALKAPKGMYK